MCGILNLKAEKAGPNFVFFISNIPFYQRSRSKVFETFLIMSFCVCSNVSIYSERRGKWLLSCIQIFKLLLIFSVGQWDRRTNIDGKIRFCFESNYVFSMLQKTIILLCCVMRQSKDDYFSNPFRCSLTLCCIPVNKMLGYLFAYNI